MLKFQSDEFVLSPFMGHGGFNPIQLQHLQPVRKEEIVRLRNDGGGITIVETTATGQSILSIV